MSSICSLMTSLDDAIQVVEMPREDAESTGNRQAADVLKLLEVLQATKVGLTVTELMARTGKSRRSIERLLHELKSYDDKLVANNLDSDHHLTKRYRLAGALPASMLSLGAVDCAALESLLETLPSGSERQALTKLLAAQNLAGVSASIDQETLIERVAYLGRVGPKATISHHILATLERAIQGFERLSLVYQTPDKGKPTPRTVEPLGLIYSRFGYLVARQARTVKTFRFELIEDVQRTGQVFDAGRFNLKAWAAESFGVYHGDELKTWKIVFSPKVAARAASVQFHPSERKIRLPDGSLQVTLRCRGERELRHELEFHPDWQGEVKINE
jgi:predicted DNA-binding transcriptional regulator YafY